MGTSGRCSIQLSLEEKVKIINELEKDTSSGAVTRISEMFNLPTYTISRIKKQKDFYMHSYLNGVSRDLKRIRGPRNPDVDKIVIRWMEEQNSKGILITESAIQLKARDIARQMGVEDFKATHGWLQSLKKRNGILFVKVHSLKQQNSPNTTKMNNGQTVQNHSDDNESDVKIRKATSIPTIPPNIILDYLKYYESLGIFGNSMNLIDKLELRYNRFLLNNKQNSTRKILKPIKLKKKK